MPPFAEPVELRYRRYSPDERRPRQAGPRFMDTVASGAGFRWKFSPERTGLRSGVFLRKKAFWANSRTLCEFYKGMCFSMRNPTETSVAAGPGRRVNTRAMAVTAVLGAVSAALYFIGFNVPLVPSFLQMDVADLPALIAAFSMGPVSGLAVCLIKDLVHLLATSTGGVGELSNLLLGMAFVLPAGVIYKLKKNRWGALLGSLAGSVAMALVSLPVNYFITYPAYALLMPMEAIMDLYRAINPQVNTLVEALIWFNMPFTFVKGLLCVAITFLIYKRISPIIKGKV